MQEEYFIKKMVEGKSEQELEEEIIQTIIETKNVLEVSRRNFEYAEDTLIDYYIYQIKAHQSKLDYLIKLAKDKKIELSRVEELKARLYNKKNIAG